MSKRCLAEAQAEAAEYKKRFQEERENRRKLHDTIQVIINNTFPALWQQLVMFSPCHCIWQLVRRMVEIVQEMRGNIRVVCRVRPRFAKEDRSVVDIQDAEPGIMVVSDDLKARKKRFDFDRICGEECTQSEVFEVQSTHTQCR